MVPCLGSSYQSLRIKETCLSQKVNITRNNDLNKVKAVLVSRDNLVKSGRPVSRPWIRVNLLTDKHIFLNLVNKALLCMENNQPQDNSKSSAELSHEKKIPEGLVRSDRLKAIADGVFAVAMTLLVLELAVPELIHPSEQELMSTLLSLWPKFLAYALSFLIAGIFWIVHHTIFDSVRYYNSTLAWINILFLLLVALIPFTTSLLGEFFLMKTSTIIYGVHLLCMFLVAFSLWTYSTSRQILIVPDLDPHTVTGARRMGYVYFCVLSIAIIIAFMSPLVSMVIYGVFVLFILVFTWIGKADHAFIIPGSKNKSKII